MKKALKILGGIFGVLILIILVAPFVVNVDQFRPKIVQAAAENMNGSLELGKLSLSLWGKIHVSVDGLKVLDKEKNQIVAVKDASFDTSYLSIFAGSPLLTLSLDQPEITVLKSKDGKLNVMSLMKESAVTPTVKQPGAAPVTATAPASSKTELPAMLVSAHFGISIVNAKLIYKDQAMALSNTIDNLNVRVKDFSLTRKTELEVWADLKTQMGTDLKIDGPLKLTADLTPDVSGGEFKGASVNANFSADDLVIEKGTLFSKKKGVPANFRFSGSLDQASMKLKEAALKFFNAEIVVSGTFDKLAGANIHFETKPVDLKPWSELIPMLTAYELEGKLALSGNVKGKPEAIGYDAKLKIENFSAKGPNLKAKPIINGTVDVTTDKIERFLIELQGPGNDLTISGKLVSFSKPQISFEVKSPKGMDLDQWIEFPKPEAPASAKKTEEAKGEPAKSGASTPASADDLDAMLDPLRKNEMAKAMSIDGLVSIAFIKAKGIRIDDIATKFQLKNLIMAISGFKMKIYDGSIAANFTMDMKPKEPQYNFSSSLAGLDLQKAVESSMPSLKNTVIGKLSFSAQGGGASFNTEPAKRHLQMKGDFKLLNAQFKALDVAKMANDAINGSIGKIGDKVPFLKGKNIHVSPSVDSRYDSMTGHFTINNGMLDAPDFVATASPKRGIDLKGSTKLGLIDESLDAKWELIDTQRVTGADQLTVNVAGKDIKNFLAKSEKEPVIIPVTVGCKWTAPCPSYTAAPEYLADVAAGRLSHVVQDAVKSQAVDAVKKNIGNALPGNLGSGLKKLFGN